MTTSSTSSHLVLRFTLYNSLKKKLSSLVICDLTGYKEKGPLETSLFNFESFVKDYSSHFKNTRSHDIFEVGELTQHRREWRDEASSWNA